MFCDKAIVMCYPNNSPRWLECKELYGSELILKIVYQVVKPIVFRHHILGHVEIINHAEDDLFFIHMLQNAKIVSEPVLIEM